MNNTPPHWATRPKEPKEIDPKKITKRIFEDGEPIFCGRCGGRLRIDKQHMLIGSCQQCDSILTKDKIGAYRIIGSKIYFDTMYGRFQEGKSLRPIIR